MEELVTRLINRHKKLDADAVENLSTLQEVAEYIQPERAMFTGKKGSSSEREKIFNSTPEDALQILSSALHSLLTPAVHAWLMIGLFGTNTDELSQEINDWVTNVTRAMIDEFNSEEGGFHSSAFEFYLDLPSFGTAAFFVDEVGDKTRYQCVPVSEIRFSENALGIVDTVFRVLDMTARQVEERWPKHGSDAITKAMEKDPDKVFKILHVIEPRKKFKKDAVIGKDMEIGSYYIELASKKLIHESGYLEQPLMVARWSKRSGESWGRGIGQKALPDIRVLNAMSRSLLIAGEKQADPPTLLPHDGFIGEFSSDGGALNYYRSTGDMKDRVITLDSKANLAALDAIIERKELAIRKMFLNDKLQTLGGPQMTAEEVRAIQNEKMRILAPVMGRLQGEFLAPLVARQFNIMFRNDKLPQPPEELQGQNLRIRYVSQISRAQKQTEAEGFTQAMGYLSPIVSVDPSIMKNFNFDVVARDTADLFGYPAKYLRSQQEIKQIEEAARQEAEKQSAMQDAQSIASIAKDTKGLVNEQVKA